MTDYDRHRIHAALTELLNSRRERRPYDVRRMETEARKIEQDERERARHKDYWRMRRSARRT